MLSKVFITIGVKVRIVCQKQCEPQPPGWYVKNSSILGDYSRVKLNFLNKIKL